MNQYRKVLYYLALTVSLTAYLLVSDCQPAAVDQPVDKPATSCRLAGINYGSLTYTLTTSRPSSDYRHSPKYTTLRS